MHIIFGDAVKEIPNSFTILELDTFELEENKVATAYCVVDKIPLDEIPLIDVHRELHKNLLCYYREKHWGYCEQVIQTLMGKWNGELDTFYTDLLLRINTYKNQTLDKDWNGIVVKKE
jgi:hypothetical protein